MDSGGVRHTASRLRNVRPVLKRPGEEGGPSRIKRKEKKSMCPKRKNIKSKYVIIVVGLVRKCLLFFVVQFVRQSYDVIGV